MSSRTIRRRVQAGALGGLAALALTACGTTGSEKGADVEDVVEEDTPAYFADNQYVGKKVTLSAEIGEVIGPTSFTLEAENFGDDSLLVVSAKNTTLSEDETVKVTGVVRTFEYADYVDEYDLENDAALYEPFVGEEFLVAKSIDVTPDTSSKTNSTS